MPKMLIRSRKSKKNRQCNGQIKKAKKDKHATKHDPTKTPGVTTGAPEG